MPTDSTRRPSRFSGFIGSSLLTTGTRLLDLPSRYGMHLLIAARLPIAEVGAFYIVFSVMTLIAGFGRLGVDRALTREVASTLGRDEPESARRSIRRAFLLTTLQSAGVAALLALAAHPVATLVLHKPALALPLILGALTIVPQNISTTAAGALAGLGRVATSQMIYSWLWPALFCIAALSMRLNVTTTLLLILGSLVVNAAVGVLLMLPALPARRPEQAGVLEPLFKVGISFFSLELVQLTIASAPPFVLGMFASTLAVGGYALAWRIVLVLNLQVSAMGAIASPQFARAAAVKDRASLARVAAQSLGLTLVLSALPMILLAVNPAFFLSRFGPGYASAGNLLRILLLGQAAAILCTAVPEMLGMTGHARSLTKVNALSLLLLLVSLGVLTPHFGATGTATATALTMILNAVAVTIAAKRQLGLIPLVSLANEVYSRVPRLFTRATASTVTSPSPVQPVTEASDAFAESSPIS